MNNLLDDVYKPDVLSCFADLSSDEVMTSPEIANRMLDLLPEEIWSDPNIKILDPACKSGVFLREAAKRFIEGENDIIPDLQQRIDHIMHNQVFGIAITEITSLMARRSLYCSKYPNGPFSIVKFDNSEGNIRFKRINHTWDGNKCKYCGASREQYERSSDLETHAYEFIHLKDIREIEKMHFDVIIGNVPYQLESKGAGRQAKPIYNLFIDQAKKLNPTYLSMIIPSRWFAGGMGLDSFRDAMRNDDSIKNLVDYTNAKDCFPGVSIGGGVCYFLRDKNYHGPCEFTNITNGVKTSTKRYLNEFPVIVRYNQAIDIIHKIKRNQEPTLATISSSLMPFGLSTNVRGALQKSDENSLTLYSSKDISYIGEDLITKGFEYVNSYKVMVSKTGAEHAGEPSKDGKFSVIPSTMKVLVPGEVCTHSYFLVGCFDNKNEADNLLSYLKTNIVRFLILMSMSGIGLSKLVMNFVPTQDFSHPWNDEMIIDKYNLSEDEVNFINQMVKPMAGD